MARIHKLSQSMINKIAAGEVIERPSSVVKELMENAVDSGATKIHASIIKGGAERIRIVDDGCGIHEEELPLALTAHATSKILEADDLFRIGTLGFRGEALASIAEVSRMNVRSRTAEAESGAQLEVVGGKFSPVSPHGGPVGTTIEVDNLFYNMPVRRKGLRATATEFGHIKEAFTRIALAMPQLDFSLSHNERQVVELTGANTLLERIAKLFGRELAENLIRIESTVDEVQITGFVGHPSQHRSHQRMQYFFLNGRHIRDKSLHHALREAYRGLLLSGRHPVCFLNLAMPPEAVDVNVHPTKVEVRFHDTQALYGQLLSTLRTKFLATDLHARIRTEDDSANSDDGPVSAYGESKTSRLRRELVEWAHDKASDWGLPDVGEKSEGPDDCPSSDHSYGSSPRHESDQPYSPGSPSPRMARFGSSGPSTGFQPAGFQPFVAGDTNNAGEMGETNDQEETAPTEPSMVNTDSLRAVQIHDRYLVTESDDGLIIVDQHALHERILYEHLKERIARQEIDVQKLLVPEPVDLTPAEAAAAIENQELLAQLGMHLEPFGGDTILVTGYPAMLANIAPAEILQELLNTLLDEDREPNRQEMIDEMLHSIACKAAIKAGDRLAPEEITALLKQRHLVEDAHHCPHGRPAVLVFSRKELDKQFKRL